MEPIKEAERIQHEIGRATTRAISWTEGLSALTSALAFLLAFWAAWEGKREKQERKEKAEKEEKMRRKKADEEDEKRRRKADEKDERRWNAVTEQLANILYVWIRRLCFTILDSLAKLEAGPPLLIILDLTNSSFYFNFIDRLPC